MHLGELDVVDSRIHEPLDMSEELLGVVSDPADDTQGYVSMSGAVAPLFHWGGGNYELEFINCNSYE